jgi:hypothetical protein
VTLLLAGFYVGIGASVGEKAETTVASNSLELIERPLGRDWLLVDARTRRARGLAFPRTLHAVFGGLVRWIR